MAEDNWFIIHFLQTASSLEDEAVCSHLDFYGRSSEEKNKAGVNEQREAVIG